MDNPVTKQPFTPADVDRILGMADQFIEDWKIECSDDPEYIERNKEFAALRPLLVLMPKMLAALDTACRVHEKYISEGFELLPEEKTAYEQMQEVFSEVCCM